MFFSIDRAEPNVHNELREWLVAGTINLNSQTEQPELLRRLQINARVVFLIQETALLQPEDFRGVKDERGNLQAGAIVTEMEDHLYLDYIATAPWNLIATLPKHSKGAAKRLICSIVRESFDRGYNGRIIVDVAGSAGFYQKMGFIETGEGSVNIPEMVLIAVAARKLIEENV
ncbi:GNAT family N-acetyltransferase [Chamaesiphon sp. VAR_48_metabat_135_sub]|uniref:GNAT family N-acetyltransferase n=1 Tax=Chamaesiphon sp. VAR_48_metabat_135_sub TaxID=2964699 RepID=UPI00286AC7D1|nr:GNAT family N-acetyltransferase [Chamaesiphon sp. VAR_48_metabat_135_sub]